jgi:IS5 family transposase
MARASKIRASKQAYISQSQLTLDGFETPFANKLDAQNRWVHLAHQIPWDSIVNVYEKQMHNGVTGASNINPRVIIGSIIIKHMCGFSDEETILQLQENMYMQYFIGYSSFSTEAPFDSSLFVEIRKRLSVDQINAINNKIVEISMTETRKTEEEKNSNNETGNKNNGASDKEYSESSTEEKKGPEEKTHEGRMLVDATACPQDIAYPTDLNLLNDAREKSEQFINILYAAILHGKNKPRTYRKQARKAYLNTAMKKNKSRKEIRNAIRKQLNFLKRNLKNIEKLCEAYPKDASPLNERELVYLSVITTLYGQQKKMYKEKVHSVEDRIVSIHQPHVRPIVRGKQTAKVEFGAKIQISLVKGFAFLDVLSWDAFNEGTKLLSAIENYKTRTGYYPKEVLADKIYCNRENRARLKQIGIRLLAKPLGRPTAVIAEHVRPGERNPIEGKFGQGKSAYGLGRIKARLSETSESWIASIIMVLNLVKLAGQVPFSLFENLLQLVLKFNLQEKEEHLLFQ